MIDITKLVQEQLDEMTSSKIVEETIQKTLKNTLLKTVEEQFSNYNLRQLISAKLETEVNRAIEQIDFSSYNGLIVNIF